MPFSPAITSVSVTNVTIVALAANGNRRGACFFNEGAAIVYLAFAATATTTAYTVQIVSGAYFELPALITTSVISAITAAGTATLRVTEF